MSTWIGLIIMNVYPYLIFEGHFVFIFIIYLNVKFHTVKPGGSIWRYNVKKEKNMHIYTLYMSFNVIVCMVLTFSRQVGCRLSSSGGLLYLIAGPVLEHQRLLWCCSTFKSQKYTLKQDWNDKQIEYIINWCCKKM